MRKSLVALTDITAGDELCYSYRDVGDEDTQTRRDLIFSQYGFECKCKLCLKPACLVCGSTKNLQHCGRYHAVRYCSPSCQRKDWEQNHKSRCKESIVVK